MKRVKLVRRRGFTRLSSKRQVTLPLRVVQQLNLRTGDELKVDAQGDRIVLTREEARKEQRIRAIREIAGSMPRVWKKGELERMRNEWR
jgi:antitoxin component of MazEF toxin-antitoxin module